MKPKIIIGIIIIVAALSWLILGGFTSSAVYYLSIPELLAQDIDAGEGIRVTGYVAPESIDWDAEKIELRFKLYEQADSLDVFYAGIMPDQMRDAQQVVAEGHLDENGQFVATKLLLKCPSKYETE